MENTMIVDLYMFFTASYGGLIAGLIYDFYRILRYKTKPSKKGTYIQDFLFWTIVAILFFYILIKVNWGELRGFIIIGFFLGIIIYIKLFSRFIYPLCAKLMELIFKIISLVFLPIRFVRSRTSPGIKKFRRLCKEMVGGVKKYKKIISSKK